MLGAHAGHHVRLSHGNLVGLMVRRRSVFNFHGAVVQNPELLVTFLIFVDRFLVDIAVFLSQLLSLHLMVDLVLVLIHLLRELSVIVSFHVDTLPLIAQVWGRSARIMLQVALRGLLRVSVVGLIPGHISVRVCKDHRVRSRRYLAFRLTRWRRL